MPLRGITDCHVGDYISGKHSRITDYIGIPTICSFYAGIWQLRRIKGQRRHLICQVIKEKYEGKKLYCNIRGSRLIFHNTFNNCHYIP